jgi:WXG100 family type VII secretion target
MATIKITPEDLEAKASDLRKRKDEHSQIYTQITQLVNDIVSVWEGESQKAFQSSFQSKDPTFKKFAEDIEAFAQLMNTAATRMRDTEAELKSQMGNV